MRLRHSTRIWVGTVVGLANLATAHADGTHVELTAIGGSDAPDASSAVVGTRIGLGRSFGPFSLFAEGSALMLPRTAREGTLWGDVAARLRIADDDLMRTTLDGQRRPLSLGLEVETLVQYEWWDLESTKGNANRMAYGIGLAGFAVESQRGTRAGVRADLRLLVSPSTSAMDVAARSTNPSNTSPREIGIIFAIGTELGTD